VGENSDLLVSHLVDGDGHMSRLLRTGVHVSIVLRDKVDVVEHKALERVLLQSFDERDVHDSRLVERMFAVLQRQQHGTPQVVNQTRSNKRLQ